MASTPNRPRTRRGRSARKSLGHGLLSASPVIRGVESEDDWLAHLAGVMNALAPVGDLETIIAGRIALNFWRLRRAARYETRLVTAADPRAIPDDEDGADGTDGEPKDPLAGLDEWERHNAIEPVRARNVLRCFDLVMFADESMPIAAADALAVIDAVRERTCGHPLESFAVPGTDKVPLTDFSSWTAALVRHTIRAICERFGKDTQGQLSSAVYVYREIARRDEVSDHDREPDDSAAPTPSILGGADFDRLLRYDAQFSRDLRQLLGDLQRLQSRRLGHDPVRLEIGHAAEESDEKVESAKRNGSTR